MKKLIFIFALAIVSAFAAEPQIGTKAVVTSPGSKATGDLLYWNGTTYVRQALGTAGQALTVGTNRTYFSTIVSTPVGTVVNSGTPVTGALVTYSGTTGTNVAPVTSTLVGTNLNIIGGILGHSLTVTNALTVVGSISTSATNLNVIGNIVGNALTATNGITVSKTITAPATTGNQEINKPAGRVNIAALGTGIVVTNSLCTANSIVLAAVATADDTAAIKSVVPASGQFTVTLTAGATAETAISFLLVN
jgi:hypothetical protein